MNIEKPINTVSNLLDLLNVLNAETETVDIKGKFSTIAKELMCNYQIVSISGEIFNIYETEFYFYSKKHPDSSVHRHNMNAGQWRVHYSGLDITFNGCTSFNAACKNKKCDKCDNLSSYGGILIRSIGNSKNLIVGPLRVQTTLLSGGRISGSNGLLLQENRGCNNKEELSCSTRCGVINTTDLNEKDYCYYNSSLLTDKLRNDKTKTRVAK